jgi:hypothetical protein
VSLSDRFIYLIILASFDSPTTTFLAQIHQVLTDNIKVKFSFDNSDLNFSVVLKQCQLCCVTETNRLTPVRQAEKLIFEAPSMYFPVNLSINSIGCSIYRGYQLIRMTTEVTGLYCQLRINLSKLFILHDVLNCNEKKSSRTYANSFPLLKLIVYVYISKHSRSNTRGII